MRVSLRRSVRAATLLTIVMIAACGGGSPSTSEPPPDTVAPTETTTPGRACASDDLLTDGSRPISGAPTDATTLADIRVRSVEGCSTVEVELATAAGAPATSVGTAEVGWLRQVGVLRIVLDPAVTSTSVADRTFDDPRIEAAYVVRGPDGGLWVDLHLAAPVGVVASARRGVIELDLVDGGPPYATSPVVADRVVLLSPTDDRVTYPITVTGYARTFEATVIVRLYKSKRVEAEVVTQAADYIETWGAFTTEIESGPNGRVELFVGEDSPEDGSEQGVRLSLVVN